MTKQTKPKFYQYGKFWLRMTALMLLMIPVGMFIDPIIVWLSVIGFVSGAIGLVLWAKLPVQDRH